MSSALQIPDSLHAGSLSVALISPNEQRRNQAIRALTECQSCRIREFISYPDSLDDLPRIFEQNVDVVLIELDSSPECALELVESISSSGLATAMVYSAQAEPALLVRCMRAGAREFLTLPFDTGAMAEALVRATALRSSTRSAKAPDGNLLAFLGAKGGSGVTTLACNFAVALAEQSRQRTLLIDLNLPLGDAAIYLGIKAQYSIANAFQQSQRLDSHLLSGLLEQHESGLYVLAAPSELGATHVSAAAIDRLLEVARQDFEHVVIDAGSRLDLQRETIFDESATIYLVTQVGIPELRNSHRLISQLSRVGSPKLEVVINRYDPRKLEIGEEHITRALTRPARWKVPNNYAAVRRMQNTATLLTQEDSPIAQIIRQMAQSVCDKSSPQDEKPEKKRGFSFFR